MLLHLRAKGLETLTRDNEGLRLREHQQLLWDITPCRAGPQSLAPQPDILNHTPLTSNAYSALNWTKTILGALIVHLVQI